MREARADGLALTLLLAFVGALLFLYGEIDYDGVFAGVDLRHYRRMAQAAPDLTTDVPRPFAYRIGGPWLAGVLPMPDPAAFRLLAVVGSMALTALLFGYIRRVERVETTPAAVAVGLFALNPYLFGFNVFNYFQLGDLFALIALVGAFWALRERRWGLLAAVLAAGVLCRESVLLAVPAVAAWVADQGRMRDDGPKAALAVLPALAVFAALRLLLDAGGPGLLEVLLDEGRKAAEPATWFRILVSAFAPLSLLPLVFWPTTKAFFRERRFLLVYGVCVVASCFFGHDQERLMQPAYLVFYPLVAVFVQLHLQAKTWSIAALLLAGWAASLHHLSARYPLPDQAARIAIVLAALGVATAVAVAVRWQGHTASRATERVLRPRN